MTPRPGAARRLVRGVVPVLVGMLIGAAVALLVTALLHKRYTATSRVLVSATGVENTSQSSARTNTGINLDTEAQLVKSAAVVERATQTYRPLTKQTFEDLVSDISVTVPPNTTVLEIAFTANAAKVARAGANALATAYLADRQGNAQNVLDRQKRNAQQSVAALTSELQNVSQQAAASKTNGYLRTRIALVKNQIDSENRQIVTLGTVQITPGRVITAASLPVKASSPSMIINLASGIGLGLILGLLAAWLLLRYRRKVRRPDDVTHVVDMPCLAVLSRPRKGSAARAEQYRRLALVSTSAVHDARRLVFATPLISPSGNQVAAEVAAALVRGGTSTVMLRVNAPDVNGRRPRGVEMLSVPNAEAVSPGEPLAAGLDRARGDHDLLVVAAGGASTTADAAAVAALADAVVLVVDVGTRSRHVRAAVRALDEVGAPMLGVVLVPKGKATEPDDPAAENSPNKRAGKNAAAQVATKRKDERSGAKHSAPAKERPAKEEVEEAAGDASTNAGAKDGASADERPEDVVAGDAAADDPPADEPAKDAAADDPPADEPAKDVVADEPAEDVVADEPAEDEPAKDVVAGTPTAKSGTAQSRRRQPENAPNANRGKSGTRDRGRQSPASRSH